MRAAWMVLGAFALIGVGTVVVAIMGSGPCTPPACQNEGDPCQQTCNGTMGHQCILVEGALRCGGSGPCDALVHCAPAPPCYQTECTTSMDCSDAATYVCDGQRCCKTTPVPADAEVECTLEGGGTGVCNGQGQCAPST